MYVGVVQGSMYLNGVPKNDLYFRKIMGYVEQFDSLPSKSSPREVIAFSAALRLDKSITPSQRESWVAAILDMLDLIPLQDEMVSEDNFSPFFPLLYRVIQPCCCCCS